MGSLPPAQYALELAPDFEKKALEQFDNLQRDGHLFYAEAKGEIIEDKGFKFEFRISPALIKKPILAANAPERRGHGGPFLNPDPKFVVARLGREDAEGKLSHVLEFSMYCMFRPHYVLHTRLFVPQSEALTLGDFEAAWAVMSTGEGDMMMIYNCGFHAGASQGHKHLQVFPEPRPFELFPEQATSETEITTLPTIPFTHFILRLPSTSSPTSLHQTYSTLLAESKSIQVEHNAKLRASPDEETPFVNLDDAPHNVIMTRRWMCVIPRLRGGVPKTGANALGMLGLVWVKDESEREAWMELGPRDFLVHSGFGNEGFVEG